MSAPTGSGKTLAYLAPIVHDLQAWNPLQSVVGSGWLKDKQNTLAGEAASATWVG